MERRRAGGSLLSRSRLGLAASLQVAMQLQPMKKQKRAQYIWIWILQKDGRTINVYLDLKDFSFFFCG
jgi:hypothetical protein